MKAYGFNSFLVTVYTIANRQQNFLTVEIKEFMHDLVG